MNKIILLTDYLNRFGSRHNDIPYRSGLDKELLTKWFLEYGYETVYINFSNVDFRSDEFRNLPVLYTSQEDSGLFYKSYIEDIVYGLELSGANVIPSYKYLKANNNKVFMEILRDLQAEDEFCNIRSFHFGTFEEAAEKADSLEYPVIIKGATGAMSRNVSLADNKESLFREIFNFSGTGNFREKLKEIVRSYKHDGYLKQSQFRKKFIIQNFIPDLKNDWKVYVFGSKIFVFYRPVFKHRGFRASGGGYDNYFYGKHAMVPDGLFDYAYKVFKKLNVPFVSLDIGFSNGSFFLLEYQLVYFGTAGILKKYSKEYYRRSNDSWLEEENELTIERVYAESVVEFLNSRKYQ